MNSVKQYPATETVTVNGIILHYAVAGEGAPVILLHGNGEDHTIFSVETEQLVAAGYKVFAPDTRGHGANAPLPEYHYADMAEDIYGFIRTLLSSATVTAESQPCCWKSGIRAPWEPWRQAEPICRRRDCPRPSLLSAQP